jgi:uncharacterized protein (TIGR00730 family)
MKSVTIFCGSSSGVSDRYRDDAAAVGKLMAERQIEVIFGGGKIGLMGTVADSCLQHGGKVTGVIPRFLRTKEVAHENLTQMHVVSTMHERKMMMHELGEAVMALPGGYGTMEELFEMMTWAQLGLHPKPIGLLNSAGYFNHLVQFFHHMHQQGFISDTHRDLVLVHEQPEVLLAMMERSVAPDVPQWINQQDI